VVKAEGGRLMSQLWWISWPMKPANYGGFWAMMQDEFVGGTKVEQQKGK